MEEINILKYIFQNYLTEDESKYIITSKDNILQIIKIFEICTNNNNDKFNLDKMIQILTFIKESFINNRINVHIFNYLLSINTNKNIYNIFIDFYLYNKYNSLLLDNSILDLIDILIKNIDITKNNIDYIIHKFSYFFYNLDENENINKYECFSKLLKILIHICGINHEEINPKCYYYLTEKNYITIPILGNNINIGITLWLKYYFNNNKGNILTINLDKNNVIKLYFENNIFIISCNETVHRLNEKEFLTKEWNCITFNYKSIKKKWIVNFFLNERQISKDFCINNKPKKDIFVYYITIGDNFYGELSSIIISNNNNNLFDIKTQKKIYKLFPYGFAHYKYVKNFPENLIPSIKYLYSPYGGKNNLINNIKNDLIFASNSFGSNIHIYKSYFKKIYLLGGINIFLPIIELLYNNIDICIKNKDLLTLYFDLISVLFKKNKKTMIEGIDNNFFMILSIFIEKLPKELYDINLLNSFFELGKIIFKENKYCTLYLDYFNNILLNENIFINFDDDLQIELWKNFYDFFEKSHKIICPIEKILNILLNYDKKYIKGEEICCEEHYNCFIDEYKYIYKKESINKVGFKAKTVKLFLLYEDFIKYSKKRKEEMIKLLIELLSLNISPCFIIKIINLLENLFNNEVDKIIKDEIFNIIKNNEEYKLLIFNLLYNDYIDIKYAALSFIMTLYQYNKANFQFPFQFIKNNILPCKKLEIFNFNNFRPSSKLIHILSQICIDKINNVNTFNIYNHDNIICKTIFTFSYINFNYTKLIELLLSFINNNQEKIDEVLDILLYININLNIEITIEFIIAINKLSKSNYSLAKKIFTFIPLLNYLLDTLIFYENFDNDIFSSIYNFIVNMVSLIIGEKKQLVIIEYIIKYYSIIKNKGEKTNNDNILLNNSINNTLNKMLTQISNTYINKDILKDNYQFLDSLISILFNYIIIFNQDKTLYDAYQSKNINLFFPSFENEYSIISFYLMGLNIDTEKQNDSQDNIKLKDILKDYSIIQIILDLFNDYFDINIYIKNKQLIEIKDKIQYIFDNLINNIEIFNNEKIINFKKRLYYLDDINKNFSLIKVIQNFFEIKIFLCKEIKEFQILINQYIDFILFIIIISVRILPENINNKKLEKDIHLNDNDINNINKDSIFFSIIFLNEVLTTNILINKNNDLKNDIIKRINEIFYLFFLIYQGGINPKKPKKITLNNSPAFYFVQYFFIEDENKINEKNNENYLKENKDNLDKFYSIILKDKLIQEKFSQLGKYYKNKFTTRHINSEILLNCAKNRLENNKVNYHYNYLNNNNLNYILDFGNFNEKSERIIKNSKEGIINVLYKFHKKNNNIIIKRNYYKSLKKKLFIFNGVWSNIELFYKNKNRIKYKILNHYTKSLTRPFLSPILDIKYYTPKFSKFDYNKLFINNDIEKPKYKNVCLDIEKILNNNKERKANDNIENIPFFNEIKKESNKEKYICCLVKTTHHIKGCFYFTEEGIIFKKKKKYLSKEFNDDIYDEIKKSCFGSYFSVYPKDKDFYSISISYKNISYIFKRLYYYNETALEIFTSTNKNYYFNFKNNEMRNTIYKSLLTKLENKINKKNLDNIISEWKNHNISNIELLMWLNLYSDRSFNDITQYPVFPWILSDYSSEKLDEKMFLEDNNSDGNVIINESLYRDLNLPLGMITTIDNGLRKNDYIKNLSYSIQQNLKNKIMLKGNYALTEKPYNYGSHYSNPMYVNNFLSRLYPFALILIELQGNKFDDPDRLFISVENTYHNSICQKGDVRELIPEFYIIPEIFHNINNFDMGIRRNKERVNNVKCPLWSGDDPYQFLYLLNIAFESDYISLNINNWIDLIFGYKQRGKEAEKANNLFRFPSYADLVPIEQMNKDEKNYFYTFVEFGICPRQIFKKPFEKRVRPKKYKEIIDKNNMLITLNINDDKKNGQNYNKKIVAIFPLQKEGIKILFNDFTGIDFTKEKLKENLFRYVKKHFFYGHGLILNDNILGNSKIDNEKIPFALYNNGQFLIEGGFINGEMVISDLVNYKAYLLFNDYDHSPVVEIQINEEETIGIVGNLLGIIYIYNIKDYNFWDYKMKINIHNQKIKSIFISNELNAFVSCSDDNYINIFSLHTCRVINSFFVENPENALLSARPLAVCIIYSNKNKKLNVYGVNGHLIKEILLENKPEYPIIYTNKYYRDYLIFANNGNISIYSLPYLEIINIIQLIKKNVYHEFDLFIKYYHNKSKNLENLIACDREKQIVYIIGEN